MQIDDLAGKVVLITGGSTGIGAAVARKFGALGARMAVHYHASEAKALQVLADIEAHGSEAIALRADARDPKRVAQLITETVAKFGRIDVLINNAGDLVERRPVVDGDDAMLDSVVDLNVRAVVAACRAAIPHFRRQGSGNIINTTSVAARNGGGPGAVLYASAKGFVSTFTRGLAKEEAPHNIRVNAVSPGLIVTPFHERHTPAAQLEKMPATIPMQRLGTPEDCVGAFLFFASDALSGYVTGQIIEVNGGQLMP
jgi:3-oxoacyl-[acyl-carrier protein] reductase